MTTMSQRPTGGNERDLELWRTNPAAFYKSYAIYWDEENLGEAPSRKA